MWQAGLGVGCVCVCVDVSLRAFLPPCDVLLIVGTLTGDGIGELAAQPCSRCSYRVCSCRLSDTPPPSSPHELPCGPSQAGFPIIVGLDLSASNLEDSTYKLPALLVAHVEGVIPLVQSGRLPLIAEEGPTYLALGADNALYTVGGPACMSFLAGRVCGSCLSPVSVTRAVLCACP